jgi:hypothetical protein
MQFLCQFVNARRLGLPAAICEEDEGYVLGLEELQGGGCARNRIMRAEEDAIYAVEVLEDRGVGNSSTTYSKAKAKSGMGVPGVEDWRNWRRECGRMRD